MTHKTAYKTELKPTPAQIALFQKALGISRFTYNWGLAGCIASYQNQDTLFQPNAIALHKHLNTLKTSDFPWMRDVSKCVPQMALRDLQNAYNRFFKKTADFPRFKKKFHSHSFRLDGAVHCADGKISLPTFGLCRLKEKDYLPEKRFTSVTVSTRAGRWFVSVPDEIASNANLNPNLSQEIIGIDLGIRRLATLSSGEVFHAPNTDRLEKRLKRYQRHYARQKPQSNNKAKTRKTIQGLHFQIANTRKDALHKLTSFVVKTKRPKRIVIEDLNVKGLLKDPHLAKSIAHGSFFEFRRQLTYKAKQHGVELLVADRWFASSKTCSSCGHVNRDFKRNEQTYTCGCGLSMDRDQNAAHNLRDYTTKKTKKTHTASSSGIQACGDPVMGSHSGLSGSMLEVQSAGKAMVPTDKQEINVNHL